MDSNPPPDYTPPPPDPPLTPEEQALVAQLTEQRFRQSMIPSSRTPAINGGRSSVVGSQCPACPTGVEGFPTCSMHSASGNSFVLVDSRLTATSRT